MQSRWQHILNWSRNTFGLFRHGCHVFLEACAEFLSVFICDRDLCFVSFHLRLCKFARSSENSATGCTKHNMVPKPKKNDSLWRNFMYHIGIITRRHSILGDSPNKNREDLILVGFYVGGLFYSEVVKISKVLE